MKKFRLVLANSLVAGVTSSFLWFAVTFWAYLETRSVLATAIIGGSFMLLSAFSGLFFGTFVDHHRKKSAMVTANLVALVAFSIATLIYLAAPEFELLDLGGVRFWAFVTVILSGAVFGTMRMIALSTTVTLLVPAELRDRANGMVGTANGISFAITSVFSGLVVGRLGMLWALAITVVLTLIVTIHLLTVDIPEELPERGIDEPRKLVDLKGALAAIRLAPGLLAIIFFSTLNNLISGVFMALVDPYGLTLVSVEAWGLIWGFLSLGFILGGAIVARRGLGSSPLRTMFLLILGMWTLTVVFPLYSSIVLLVICFFLFMCIIPAVEACEQTIIQRVVPFETQGRVFGFAQTVEASASPITAFLIGPIAEFWVIPFMTVGRGTELIGPWFGTGPDRGMALVFIVAGVIGLVVTFVAMRSRAYVRLHGSYEASLVAT